MKKELINQLHWIKSIKNIKIFFDERDFPAWFLSQKEENGEKEITKQNFKNITLLVNYSVIYWDVVLLFRYLRIKSTYI